MNLEGENNNPIYKIDPNSEAYKKYYVMGMKESLDKLDLVMKDLLTVFIDQTPPITQEEIIKYTKKYLDDRNFNVSFINNLDDRLFEYLVILGCETYTDEDVSDSSVKGDDFEETHADLLNLQRNAVSLRGKFRINPYLDLKDILTDIRIAIEFKLKELNSLKEFKIEYEESLPIYVNTELISEYLSVLRGDMTVSEISSMTAEDLESFGTGIIYINLKLKNENILPEFARGMISIDSEEDKQRILEQISFVRSVIREHTELYYVEKIKREFKRDDLDEKIRDLLQDLDVARVSLLDLDYDTLIEVYERVKNYDSSVFNLMTRDIFSNHFSEAVGYFLNKEGNIEEGDALLLNNNLKRLLKIISSIHE